MKGPAPFGTRWSDGRLAPDLSETAVVCALVEAFVTSSGRIKATATALNSEGHRTRSGARWSDTAVNRVLRNRELSKLIPQSLWRRCEGLLADRISSRSRLHRRSAHPLGGSVHCQCGDKMYIRGDGLASKYVCRGCRDKISANTLDRLFRSSLTSVEIDASEIVAALKGNPRAAELTRMLGGRRVAISEIWPTVGQPQQCRLVDLLVARIVVGSDVVSIIFAGCEDSAEKNPPSLSNSLPSSYGSESVREQSTTASDHTAREHLAPLLTVDEVSAFLRTSSKSVYSMIDRAQLPGVTRLGRRLLIRRDDLLRWLNESRASSQQERRP